jgi:hypothetical protein
MARGPKNLRLTFGARTLTHFGGLVLLHRFVHRIGLRTLLGQRVWFPQRNHRYSIGEALLAVLYPIILGLGRIETTQLLRRNGVFHYLTGLPTYPDPQTLRRFLLRFAQDGLGTFERLHDDLRKRMLHQPGPRRSVFFDLDSTVLTVYGRQRGAEVGFNPHKRGRPSYLPLLCVEGRTHDCWAASYHPGNTHVTTVVVPLLRRALMALPISRLSVRVRADSAFYDHALIEWLEAHKVSYAIVARLTKPLQARVASARYTSAGKAVGVAEFSYQPQRWPGPRRFVVIRRPIPEEPSWQLSLFQMGRFLYQVIVTDLDLTPVHVWQFYNDRAGVELVIRELKEAYALGKIPSRQWAVNETYFQLVVFAYNLLNWFRRLCLPPRFQSWSLQTLRNQLLLVPAELVRPQGVPTLKLPRSFPHQQAFWETLRQIDQLSL